MHSPAKRPPPHLGRERGRPPLSRLAALVLSVLVAGPIILVAGPASAAVNDGLILWYKLNERSGKVATDSSGKGRNGVVRGQGTWSGDEGLAFNGYNSAVAVPADLMKGLDSITVAFDVLIDPAQDGSYFIYGFGNANQGQGNGYLFATGNNLRTAIASAGWWSEKNTAPVPARPLARGRWKHLTYTQTGSTGVLYEDGVEVGRTTDIPTKPGDIGAGKTTANLIGQSLYAPDRRFKGRLRDFRVYDRAISPAEVTELQPTANQIVSRDGALLALGDVENVVANLPLPTAGPNGSAITWASTDPAVVATNGTVTRPALGRPDAKVVLTATLTRGAVTETRTFTVKVPAHIDDSQKVTRAVDAIRVNNLADVRDNLTLPTAGADGTVVTWRSDRPTVIDPSGRVTRPAPGSGVTTVVLIATATLNGASASRTFTATVPDLPATADLAPKGYLFSYFVGEGPANGEQLYFALSDGNDPVKWRELNGRRPVLTSTLGEEGLRDPFIIRSPNGDKFYQIATDLRVTDFWDWSATQRFGSKSIMVWESTDLVNWSEQRMVQVAPDSAGNAWAPEAFYDSASGDYIVFWASKIYNNPQHSGEVHNRMMYVRTRDFRTFSEPQVYYDPGYAVIDTTMIKHGGKIYRFTKDERDRGTAAPTGKHVFQEVGDSVLGTFSGKKEGIGAGHINHGEGPTIYKSNTEEKWYLWLDEHGRRGYVPFETTNLATGDWKPVPNYQLPSSPRHGTVLPVTQAEYDRLLRKYAPERLVESLADVTVRTPVGTAPVLPAKVLATYADGKTTKELAVTWEAISPAAYAVPGTFLVKGTIAESATVQARANVTVYVEDVANAGPDVAGAEGAAIPLAGSAGGDGAVDWSHRAGAGVDSGATCAIADPKTPATTITCTDDGTYEVTLKVGEKSDSATVTVANAPPRIGTIGAPATAETDQAIEVTAAFTDAGGHDTHACVVDWKDGSTSTGTITGGSCRAGHTYAAAGDYDVTITVTDDDGGAETRSSRIAVSVKESVSAGPDVAGLEGAAIPLAGAVTGVPGAGWTYRAAAGVDAGATCAIADPKAVTTTITCTDDGSYEVTLSKGERKHTATVTVANAAPKLGAVGGPTGPVLAGTPVEVTAAFTDAGAHDTHTCVVDWKDGTTSTGKAAGGKCAADHTYTVAGEYAATMTVTDDDGAADVKTVSIKIEAADTADAGPNVTGVEGAELPLAGTVAGKGAVAWTYRAVSGVDTGATCAIKDAGRAATAITCTDDGTYEVTLKVGQATDTTTVTVTNAVPVIGQVKAPTSVEAGTSVATSAAFSDAGRHDTHTCSVDWRDGSTTAGSVSAGTCAASHSYAAAGAYDVVVTVTDDDGGAATKTLRVVVKAKGGGGGGGIGGLPITGSPILLVVWTGAAVLALGGALLLIGRRRARSGDPAGAPPGDAAGPASG